MVAKIETDRTTTQRVVPQGNRVLLKPEEATATTKGGIILPDAAKEKPQTARVVAIGDGLRLENGNLVPISLEKGQLVIIGRYSGTEVVVDGVSHLIVEAGEILARIEN